MLSISLTLRPPVQTQCSYIAVTLHNKTAITCAGCCNCQDPTPYTQPLRFHVVKLNVKGDHWGDLGVDGWIILGWISKRWDVDIWTGLGWPRIETGGGRL